MLSCFFLAKQTAIYYQIDDLLDPEGSGLHLGNIDYVNTLQVGAASNRRDGQRLQRALQVREEVGLTDGLFEKR
jgi:hypothetical protein